MSIFVRGIKLCFCAALPAGFLNPPHILPALVCCFFAVGVPLRPSPCFTYSLLWVGLLQPVFGDRPLIPSSGDVVLRRFEPVPQRPALLAI